MTLELFRNHQFPHNVKGKHNLANEVQTYVKVLWIDYIKYIPLKKRQFISYNIEEYQKDVIYYFFNGNKNS